MAEFDKDEDQVKGLTKVNDVILLALVSNTYKAKPETRERFNGWLEWVELAEHYGNDPILLRADDVFRS